MDRQEMIDKLLKLLKDSPGFNEEEKELLFKILNSNSTKSSEDPYAWREKGAGEING